jgi:ribonuclease HII
LCANFEIESKLIKLGYRRISGIDEAGRGALCGPVIAAAVIFDQEEPPINGINDSKLISPKKREKLARAIYEKALGVGVGFASNLEIDAKNIHIATIKAMKRAIENLPIEPDFLLIDGRPLENIPYPQKAIIKGDRKSFSIAAASIIAKVIRDEIMRVFARLIPGYSLDKNKGYGTNEHFYALKALGPTLLHRISFKLKW